MSLSRKGLSQRDRAKQELQKLLGRRVNRMEYRTLVEDIQQGRARFVRRVTNHLTVWRYNADGREVVLTYDSHRGLVAGAFSPEEVSA